ncbi:DUF1896 domain-containing protein [Ginsengibacter hankyongi]|uniref:DUF1896 domain-containing protein n=1 Tax=Ginsengibacter hankyongi TaxID=2607284 RepID=A0A5J5IFS0_9BACT|nr:DUF1896 family protein [Ginsengibacter hankyongi]KAA9038703.1 DUF1896 domain-containing protein [Ginsengibacter hankyongi]
MQKILIKKLHDYIRENNPDILVQLEEEKKVTEYLSDKIKLVDGLLQETGKQPAYIIEEACMDILTEDLRPSKYHYIYGILEEEFEATYRRLQNSGTLQFEVINLIKYSQPLFDAVGFTLENEDNRELKYSVTGAIAEYLESNK